jgi:glycosyltransferase involved in cell wall biosynthesis
MRIAIYENLPPGGAKRAAFELGRYLALRHEIDLYQLSITDNRAFDLGPFVQQVFRYPYAPLGGRLDARLKAGHYAPRSYTIFGPLRRLHRRIAGDIQQRGYDRVLVHTDAMTQSPYLLRWLGNLPSFYYCQEVLRIHDERAAQRAHRRRLLESPFPVGPLRVLEDNLVRRRLAAADAANTAAAGTILVNSKYSRERVWAAYGRDAIVCYLGVDHDRFRPDSAVARRREVLSIGGPPWLKGHDLVIEALSRIDASRRPALRIVMAGRADAQSLERLAGERGVSLTIEHGLDEAALIDRYRSAIATICAAHLEPFGLTALESMACATPVIAIDEGGYRESITPGVTGLLVEPNATALANAIEQLVNEPQTAASLGRSGRAAVEKSWTWPQRLAQLEAVLTRTEAR